MPWRAQSQPFQTVRNLPFVRRDLPTICEELGAMSLLPGDRWSYGWVNLRNLLDTVLTATGTCYILNPPIDECSPPAGDIPNSFACLISPPSNNLLWQWKITHLQMILLYDPNKMCFFSFFSIAMLNYQRIYCCWTYPHAGSVTRFRLWAYKIYTKNLAKVPCLVASTSISAWFHYHLLLLVGGIPTPLKNLKVSWDDDIPNIWKIKHVPNHQPGFNL